MTTAISTPQFLTREQPAEYLSIKPQTLAVWHTTRRYPIPVVKVGRSVRYRVADLDKFIASRIENGESAE